MSDSLSLIEDIYAALKADLLSGRHTPGERVDISDLVKRFPASKTPILLVLNRLVGEGLLETRPHDGYYLPRITTDSLRELYECDIQILTMILDKQLAEQGHAKELPPVSFTETDSVADTETLFMAIAVMSGNREFQRILAGLNDRLRPLRRVKARTALIAPTELSSLKDAWREGGLADLRGLIANYHRHRIDRVSEFVALAYTAPIRRSEPRS